MSELEPVAVAALDQLEATTSNQARQVAVYYKTLIEGGIPTDTAAVLASYLARDLRRMVFHQGKQ